MLLSVRVHDYAVGHRLVVGLLHQKTVCCQLQDVVSIRIGGSSALYLNGNQAAVPFIANYIVRLAADTPFLGEKSFCRAVQIRVDHSSVWNPVLLSNRFCGT